MRPIDEYYEPLWRFGTVVTSDLGTLTLDQAISMGPLFGEDSKLPSVADAYGERLKSLLSSEGSDSRIIKEPFFVRTPQKDELKGTSERIGGFTVPEVLDGTKIRYAHVPILSFPYFIIEMGNLTWVAREAVTLCGGAAQSKLWLHIRLASAKDGATYDVPLTAAAIKDSRKRIEPVREWLTTGLFAFYDKLLQRRDVRNYVRRRTKTEVKLGRLKPFREIEILGIMADLYRSPKDRIPHGKTDPFSMIGEVGFSAFQDRYSKSVPAKEISVRQILDFVRLSEDLLDALSDNWVPASSRILNFANQAPTNKTAEAVVLSALVNPHDDGWAKTFYAVIAQRWMGEGKSSTPSRMTSNIMAGVVGGQY